MEYFKTYGHIKMSQGDIETVDVPRQLPENANKVIDIVNEDGHGNFVPFDIYYDGTKEDAIAKAKELQKYVQFDLGIWSRSFLFATGEDGKPKWVMSQNLERPPQPFSPQAISDLWGFDMSSPELQKIGFPMLSKEASENVSIWQQEAQKYDNVKDFLDSLSTYYRGGGKGKFVSPNKDFASEYGKVMGYKLIPGIKLFHILSEEANDIAERMGFDNSEDAEDLWFNPTKELESAITSAGYDGFINGEDNIYIVDEKKMISVPELIKLYNRVHGKKGTYRQLIARSQYWVKDYTDYNPWSSKDSHWGKGQAGFNLSRSGRINLSDNKGEKDDAGDWYYPCHRDLLDENKDDITCYSGIYSWALGPELYLYPDAEAALNEDMKKGLASLIGVHQITPETPVISNTSRKVLFRLKDVGKTASVIKRATLFNNCWISPTGEIIQGKRETDTHGRIIVKNKDIFYPLLSEYWEEIERLVKKTDWVQIDEIVRPILCEQGWIRVAYGFNMYVSFIGDKSRPYFYQYIDNVLGQVMLMNKDKVEIFNREGDFDKIVGIFRYQEWVDAGGSAEKAIQQRRRIKGSYRQITAIYKSSGFFIMPDGEIKDTEGMTHQEYLYNNPDIFRPLNNNDEVWKEFEQEWEESGDYWNSYTIFNALFKAGVIRVYFFGPNMIFEGNENASDFYTKIDKFLTQYNDRPKDIMLGDMWQYHFSYQDWLDAGGSSKKAIQQAKRIKGCYRNLSSGYFFQQGFILPNEEVIELGKEYTQHTDYLERHPETFKPFFFDEQSYQDFAKGIEEGNNVSKMLWDRGVIRYVGTNREMGFQGDYNSPDFFRKIDNFLSSHPYTEKQEFRMWEDKDLVFTYQDWLDAGGSSEKARQQAERIKGNIKQASDGNYWVSPIGKVFSGELDDSQHIQTILDNKKVFYPILKDVWGMIEDYSYHGYDSAMALVCPYLFDAGWLKIRTFYDNISCSGDVHNPNFFISFDMFLNSMKQKFVKININDRSPVATSDIFSFTYQDWADANGSSEKVIQQAKRIKGNTELNMQEKSYYIFPNGEIKEIEAAEHWNFILNNQSIFQPYVSPTLWKEFLEDSTKVLETGLLYQELFAKGFIRVMMFMPSDLNQGGNITFEGNKNSFNFYQKIDNFLGQQHYKYDEIEFWTPEFESSCSYQDWLDVGGSAEKAIQQVKRIKGTKVLISAPDYYESIWVTPEGEEIKMSEHGTLGHTQWVEDNLPLLESKYGIDISENSRTGEIIKIWGEMIKKGFIRIVDQSQSLNIQANDIFAQQDKIKELIRKYNHKEIDKPIIIEDENHFWYFTWIDFIEKGWDKVLLENSKQTLRTYKEYEEDLVALGTHKQAKERRTIEEVLSQQTFDGPMKETAWVSPEGYIFDATKGGHDEWIGRVYRNLYNDNDMELGRNDLLKKGWTRVISGNNFEVWNLLDNQVQKNIEKVFELWGNVNDNIFIGFELPYWETIIIRPYEIQQQGVINSINIKAKKLTDKNLTTVGAYKQLKQATIEDDAHNYKTVDEFLASFGTPLYHGTNSVVKEGLKPGADSSLTFGPGIYLTDNYNIAKEYGTHVVTAYPVRPLKLLTINRNSKQYSNIVDKYDEEQVKYIHSLLSEKYDGIKCPERAGDGNEIVIYNPELLITEEQLKDIYNKAKEVKMSTYKQLKAELEKTAVSLSHVLNTYQTGGFVCITAKKEGMPDKEFLEKQANLCADIRDKRYGFVAALGAWEDDKGVTQTEDSVYVPYMTKEEAMELGSKYEQYSILYAEAGHWQEIKCDSGEVVRKGTKFRIIRENDQVQGAYTELQRKPNKRYQLL